MNTSIDAVIIKLQNFCSFYNLRIILILRLVLRLAPVTALEQATLSSSDYARNDSIGVSLRGAKRRGNLSMVVL